MDRIIIRPIALDSLSTRRTSSPVSIVSSVFAVVGRPLTIFLFSDSEAGTVQISSMGRGEAGMASDSLFDRVGTIPRPHRKRLDLDQIEIARRLHVSSLGVEDRDVAVRTSVGGGREDRQAAVVE